MKKLKKIIFLILIIVILIIDIKIIEQFDDITMAEGIIDRNENIKIDFKYETIRGEDLVHKQKYIHAVTKDKKSVYIDLEGNEYDYATMPEYSKNRATAYSISLEKEGYIDCDENKTSEFIYDMTYNYENGYAEVEIDEKHGIIDINGKTVVPCEYDEVSVWGKNFFCVGKDNQFFMININNEIIAEYEPGETFKFTELNNFSKLGDISSSDDTVSNPKLLQIGIKIKL